MLIIQHACVQAYLNAGIEENHFVTQFGAVTLKFADSNCGTMCTDRGVSGQKVK